MSKISQHPWSMYSMVVGRSSFFVRWSEHDQHDMDNNDDDEEAYHNYPSDNMKNLKKSFRWDGQASTYI